MRLKLICMIIILFGGINVTSGDYPDNITDICVYRNMLYRFSDERVIEDRI